MNRQWRKAWHYFGIVFAITLSLLEGGCASLRPNLPVPTQDQAPLFIPPTLVEQPTSTPTQKTGTTGETQPANCTNTLSYLKDLTIPDGSVVKAGDIIDKQWQVRNDGTCNWNESYTIQLISGSPLGASSPQAIVPARGGAEGVIQIQFIAPTDPGNYTSTWQAFDPSGHAFGDYFSIKINVSAP